MGFASLAIDIGVLRNANQNLWNALDAGALAGASQLPPTARTRTRSPASTPTPTTPAACRPGTTVGFRCVIGSTGTCPG